MRHTHCKIRKKLENEKHTLKDLEYVEKTDQKENEKLTW